MRSSDKDRMEILILIGVGDMMRIEQEVCRLFLEVLSDRKPISQSTVSIIEQQSKLELQLMKIFDITLFYRQLKIHIVPFGDERFEYWKVFSVDHFQKSRILSL